jgi:hypothetical protein
MSRTRWIALSVAAVAAGLFAWIRLAHQGAASRSDGLVVGKRFPPGILDEASAATRSVAKPTTATPSSDHAAAYRDAGDLLAFLDSLAPAADRGDASAMYWMFRASRRCTRDYSLYLGGPERSRSLERALAINAAGRMDEKSTREIYARCAAFTAAPGNAYRDWGALLKRASDAGHPVAQATLAFELALKLMQAQDPRVDPNLVAKIEQDMRDLARAALRSKDPAALIQLGHVMVLLKSPRVPADDDESIVWMIAACQRGYDCSVDNEEFRYACALEDACQPFDTVLDMLRRQRPEEFPALELRATEINARLDADRFDEFGL